MNRLAQMPDQDQILRELNTVLDSAYFSTRDQQKRVLRYLVKQALAGIKTTERSVAKEVYGRLNFDPMEQTLVREAAREIRKNLAPYYENEGRANSLHIELPPRTYTPVFKEQSQPPPTPGPSAPTAPDPPPNGTERRTAWRRPLVAGGVLAAGALLAFLLWLCQDRQCGGSISIAEPKTGTVHHKYVVQAARASEQWFCRCNDYVIVEAVDLQQWYVQGRLGDGSQPSLTATFGDPDTPPGTRYSVFILSTKAELQRGPLTQSSPIVAGATKSAPVEVTLGKP